LANSKTTKDLIKGALNHSGELTDGLSDFHQLAVKYINKIYKDVLSASSIFDVEIGEPFNFARARQPLSLTLEPAYVDGTVSLTQGSTAGTFSNPPTDSHKDRYLKLADNRPTYYKIVAHNAGEANFTIDSEYVEETGSALDFKSIKLIYDLGNDILRLLEPFRVYATDSQSDFPRNDRGKVFSMETKRFREEYPLKWMLEGIPERFTIIYRDDTEYLVQFERFPSKQVKCDIDYVPFPEDLIDTDDSIPVIPREYRDVLEFGTAFYLLQDKHDDRADRFFNLAKTALTKMLQGERRQVTHGSENKGRLIARADQENVRARFFWK
jgi:hypothetical protein